MSRGVVGGVVLLVLLAALVSSLVYYGTTVFVISMTLPLCIALGGVIVVAAVFQLYKPAKGGTPGLASRLPWFAPILAFVLGILGAAFAGALSIGMVAPVLPPGAVAEAPFFFSGANWPGTFREGASLSPVLAVTAIVLYHQVVTIIHICSLAVPAMRSQVYAVLVVYPSTAWCTASLLSLPCLPVLFLLPAVGTSAAAGVFLVGSYLAVIDALIPAPLEQVHIRAPILDLDPAPSRPQLPTHPTPLPLPPDSLPDPSPRVLRIAQITDPHVGYFLSSARLRGYVEDLVAASPDLVLLTGDYFTWESDMDAASLRRALAPLEPLAKEGRVIAIHGNHDVETTPSRSATHAVCSDLSIPVLEDTTADITIRDIRVRIAAFDWHGKGGTTHRLSHGPPLSSLVQSPAPDTIIYLVHDPTWLTDPVVGDWPGGLVLSGHTHGGLIGCRGSNLCLSCGCKPRCDGPTGLDLVHHPAAGLFSKGNTLLYVHRGQGFRALMSNFISRVGVPPEHSILHLHLPS